MTDPDFDDESDQSVLGRALDAARAGEDKALTQQVRDGGEQTVRLLTGLWRLMRTHSPDNDAFDAPVADFVDLLVRLHDLLGPLHVVCVEGQVYLNDVRVRMDERTGGTSDLEHELRKHGCGGIHFGVPLTGDQVRVMLHILAGRPEDEHPVRALATRLREAGLDSISVNGLFRLRVSGEATGEQGAATHELQDTLNRASGLVTDAWDNLAAGRTPNPLPVRRLVNEIVDGSAHAAELYAEGEDITVSTAHARHALRVCTLAVLIGADLGLSPPALADLGVAAMFHDVGYGAREDGFAPPFERHASAGARMLIRQRGFHAAKIKRLLATLEHHDAASTNPILISRILHIADDFETFTRQRPGGALHSPAEALALMQGAAGSSYDAGLLQILINRVGKYPPGTVLRLRDGSWVVSISGVRSPETFARPLCRLVRTAAGGTLGVGPEVDLALGGAVVEVISVRASAQAAPAGT